MKNVATRVACQLSHDQGSCGEATASRNLTMGATLEHLVMIGDTIACVWI